MEKLAQSSPGCGEPLQISRRSEPHPGQGSTAGRPGISGGPAQVEGVGAALTACSSTPRAGQRSG